MALSKNLLGVMNELFVSKAGSDVTFIVHEKEIQAHKLIVIARSPVFKAMIEGLMAPEDQRHEINDPEITFKNFQNFLRFLYTDNCDFGNPFYKSLIRLGSFYDVQYLLDKCTEKIDIRLSDPELYDPKEAFKYAELGLLYSPGTDELLRICLKCISGCKASFNYRDSDGEVKWISFELTLRIVQVCRRTKILDENKIHPDNAKAIFKAPILCKDVRSITFCQRFKDHGIGKFSCKDAEFAMRTCRHSCGYCDDTLYDFAKTMPPCK